jgi:2-polyprenyl-6-methoxyphenol hydroxylase-like FAD-dependent oxidoreductase
MGAEFDAIVVGARCAGAPTAMLLARKGYKVLLLDRATFPSDTISTHIVHPPGIAALRRWGLLERVQATGCPPLEGYSFDFGPFEVAGTPRGVEAPLCPRRTVLDQLLVEAAVEAGAELREGFTVEDLVREDGRVVGVSGVAKGGAMVSERARVVIGADGRRSLVARAVDATRYHERPTLAVGYYAYWSGVPADRFEAYVRPDRAFAAVPTNDGLTIVIANWPSSEFAANRTRVQGEFMRTLELVPELAERVQAGTRETRFAGAADLPNVFVQPYGPGWTLVGDAGYHKDPVTAQGISDAFRDAEAMAEALDDVFSGRETFDERLARYQRERDEAAMPMFELTCDFATLEPPKPELQELLAAMVGNRDAMDGFAGVFAGTVPVPEFFSPENTARIMAGAAEAA